MLYLDDGGADGGARGGPTIVLDQRPAAQEGAARAWLVEATAGALLLFAGDRLHGVLPRPAPATPSAATFFEVHGCVPARSTLCRDHRPHGQVM